MTRTFDVALLGATGFTGRLVAAYLAEHHGRGDVRVALAGRDLAKLNRLRAELVRRFDIPEWPVRVVDSFDREALAALAAESVTVCTTVGPYARYGAELVAACVDAGTHCCDLTAEVPFIRAMIDSHHERAGETGARIVHSCGFDSIPSDLGTFMLQRAMAERHGGALAAVDFCAVRLEGGFSGGTFASMLDLADAARRDPAVRRLLGDPYALNPTGERSGPDGPGQTGVRRDPRSGRWTAPFLMESINTRVVRRTNALLGHAYGRDFRYAESMGTGHGVVGLVRASLFTGLIHGFLAVASFGPARPLLTRMLPAPGEGPDEDQRAAGFFVMELVGRGRDADGRPVELVGRVEGEQDPGYVETAKMLAESALCLAQDGDTLPSRGGVLTPAAAMGDALLVRLRRAGLVFEV